MALTIRPAARNRLLAVALLAACAYSVLSPRPWQPRVRGLAHSAARPALGAFAAAHGGLQRALARLAGLWRAADEIERLRQENQALREALARKTDQARHTAAQLRDFTRFDAFLQRSLVRPLRVLPANVLAADTSPWRHSLVIDRGSQDGLRRGAPAVWGDSIVGTVVALRPNAAVVRLITDADAGLKVRVDRTGNVGLLRGIAQRDGLLTLKWIHFQPAEEGDRIVTSGQNPLIPPGLLAGEVARASERRTPHCYDIQVRPVLDLDRLTELLIVLYDSADAEELLQEQAK